MLVLSVKVAGEDISELIQQLASHFCTFFLKLKSYFFS